MNSCRTVNNTEFTIRNVLIIPSIIGLLCYEFHRSCQCVETYLQNFMSCWCDCCANQNEMSEKWQRLEILFSIKIIFLTLRAPAVWHIWWRFINDHLTLFNETQAFNSFQMMINGIRDLAACNNFFLLFPLTTTSIAIFVLTSRQLSHYALLHIWLHLQFDFGCFLSLPFFSAIAICFSCWFSCCILFHMSRRNNHIICFFLQCSQQNATITLNKHDKFNEKENTNSSCSKDVRETGICVNYLLERIFVLVDHGICTFTRSGINPNRSAVCDVDSFVCRVSRIERYVFILMLSQLKAVNALKRHCVWLHAIMLYSCCSVRIFFFLPPSIWRAGVNNAVLTIWWCFVIAHWMIDQQICATIGMQIFFM